MTHIYFSTHSQPNLFDRLLFIAENVFFQLFKVKSVSLPRIELNLVSKIDWATSTSVKHQFNKEEENAKVK